MIKLKINKSYSTDALSCMFSKILIWRSVQANIYPSWEPPSGKSTLLNLMGILDSYDSGEYYLNGTLIKNLTETQAARYRNELIGFVFQSST